MKVGFAGFAVGARVTGSISQSTGGAGSFEVEQWNKSAPIQSVAIRTARTGDRIAPDPVVFEAVPADFTLPSLPVGATEWRPAEHRLLYKWTFTASGRSWMHFRSPFTEWRQHDVRYGPKVTQMLFDPDSDFTATVEVWGPNGEYATNSTTILAADIVDPETYFAGANTVIVDPSGAGDPSRPDAVVETTVDDAFAASNNNKRILLKRGETYTQSTRYNTDGKTDFYIGEWGRGALPIVHFTGSNEQFLLHQGLTNVPRLVGLDMRGAADLTADLTDANPVRPERALRFQTLQTAVVCNCVFSKHALIDTLNCDANTHIVFWDTKITEWQDYGALLTADGGRLTLVGCDVTQNPDVGSGGPKSVPETYEEHGPVRISGFGEVYVDCVSFGSYNGHFGAGDYTDIQPCLRVTEVATGASVYLSRIFADGVIALAPTSGGSSNFPVNGVVDKAVILQTAAESNTGNPIQLKRTGVTVRNALVVSDNVASAYFDTASSYGWQVSVETGGNISGTTLSEPVEIYGLTLVDSLSSANNDSVRAAVGDDGTYNNVTVSGVITHAPNKDIPDTPLAPMVEGAVLDAQSLWKGHAYRPGAFRYDLESNINATQTTGIIIDENLTRRLRVEGAPMTLILGGDETGEQISVTGVTPNGGGFELTGVTRGANGTTATSHTAGSAQVWNGAVSRLTAFAATADFAKRWTPAAGSPARGGATGDTLKPLDDILGNPRTGVAAVDDGAFQVSS